VCTGSIVTVWRKGQGEAGAEAVVVVEHVVAGLVVVMALPDQKKKRKMDVVLEQMFHSRCFQSVCQMLISLSLCLCLSVAWSVPEC